MSNRALDLENYVQQLEASGQYRVLRKIPPLLTQKRDVNPTERIVAIVDTETTGLDPQQDEVIEFAGIALTYSLDGQITGAVASFSQLREPNVPLSADTIRLTGLTKSMLNGREINKQQLEDFIQGADLIVAHNAAFDRPFCEQLADLFRKKPWACSATEIDWSGLGYDGAKLTYLATRSGWFYEAHRALDDCNALATILSASSSRGENETPFQQLLKSARQTKTRLSFRAPYLKRDLLRAQGFRWKSGRQMKHGFWYADFLDREVKTTIDWLFTTSKIKRASIRCERISAFERYR